MVHVRFWAIRTLSRHRRMTESDPQRTSAPADRLQNARDSPLTDLRQFDILEFGLAGGDRNAIRSSEAT